MVRNRGGTSISSQRHPVQLGRPRPGRACSGGSVATPQHHRGDQRTRSGSGSRRAGRARPPGRARSPSSSCSSRRAAAPGVSPGSVRPPGSAHCPACPRKVDARRVSSNAGPGCTRTTPTAAGVRSGRSTGRRGKRCSASSAARRSGSTSRCCRTGAPGAISDPGPAGRRPAAVTEPAADEPVAARSVCSGRAAPGRCWCRVRIGQSGSSRPRIRTGSVAGAQHRAHHQHAQQHHHRVADEHRAQEPVGRQALVRRGQVVEHPRHPDQGVDQHPAQQQPPARQREHRQRHQPQRVLRAPHLVDQQERRQQQERQRAQPGCARSPQAEHQHPHAAQREQARADQVQHLRGLPGGQLARRSPSQPLK